MGLKIKKTIKIIKIEYVTDKPGKCELRQQK